MDQQISRLGGLDVKKPRIVNYMNRQDSVVNSNSNQGQNDNINLDNLFDQQVPNEIQEEKHEDINYDQMDQSFDNTIPRTENDSDCQDSVVDSNSNQGQNDNINCNINEEFDDLNKNYEDLKENPQYSKQTLDQGETDNGNIDDQQKQLNSKSKNIKKTRRSKGTTQDKIKNYTSDKTQQQDGQTIKKNDYKKNGANYLFIIIKYFCILYHYIIQKELEQEDKNEGFCKWKNYIIKKELFDFFNHGQNSCNYSLRIFKEYYNKNETFKQVIDEYDQSKYLYDGLLGIDFKKFVSSTIKNQFNRWGD